MNKIEEMIKQLCPNGVEWKKLGEICTIVRGIRVVKSQLKSEGKYPVFQNSLAPMGYFDEYNRNSGTYLISAGAAGDIGFCKTEFWSADDCLTFLDSKVFIEKYLYYFLKTKQPYLYSNVRKASIPRLSKDVVANLSIPLPPLPIQTEIVRILDKFVEQQEQLEKLIELRKKQYEYYTHKLYSDLKQKGVHIKRLGDFCDLLSGNPFDSNLMVNDGIRLMRGMNIKRGSLDFSEDLNKYWKTDDGLEKYYLNRDDIVISMDGSLVGRSFAYIEEKHLPLLLVQRVARIRTNKNNSKYLYHYLANGYFAEHVDLKKTAGAIPHISMKDISSFQIPLPDIETQNAIVKTLDSFETSIAALTSALEASKRRYEYYRDKMMRF